MPLRVALTCACLACLACGEPYADPDPARFAEAMRDFAEQDAARRAAGLPLARDVVFVGSSSIRLWDLDASFPGLDALNRGFGAAHLSDVVHLLEPTVLRYRPRVVVLFAGGNDVWSGASPEHVRDHLRRLAHALFAALPRARLVVLALKTSPRRIDWLPGMRETNRLLAAVAAGDERIDFVPETLDLLLDQRGAPRPALFAGDGLHLGDAGYAAWTRAVRPAIERALAATRTGG